MKKGRQPNSAWMKTQMDRQPSYVRSGSGVLRVCLAEDGVIWTTRRVGSGRVAFGFVALMDSITDYAPLVKEIYNLFFSLKTLYYGQLALCKVGRSC
jgi:hypothetical protein